MNKSQSDETFVDSLEYKSAHYPEMYASSPILMTESEPIIKLEHDEERNCCGVFIVEQPIKQEFQDPSVTEFSAEMEKNEFSSIVIKQEYNSCFVLLERLDLDEIRKWKTRARVTSKKKSRSVVKKEPKTLQVFSCDLCNNTFETKLLISRHMNSHQKPICTECHQTFHCMKLLRKHFLLNHVEDPQACDICGKFSRNSLKLTIHKRLAHRGGTKCKICGLVIKRMSNHMRRHRIPSVKIPCEICGEIFLVESMDRHIQNFHTVHPDGKMFQCSYCPQNFIFKSELKM